MGIRFVTRMSFVCIVVASYHYGKRRISLFVPVCHRQVSISIIALSLCFPNSIKFSRNRPFINSCLTRSDTSCISGSLVSFDFNISRLLCTSYSPCKVGSTYSARTVRQLCFFTVASCAFDCLHLTNIVKTVHLNCIYVFSIPNNPKCT